MMQKFLQHLLLLCLLACGFTATAQRSVLRPLNQKPKSSSAMLQPTLKPRPLTGLETYPAQPGAIPLQTGMFRNSPIEEIIGGTNYDIQTNGTESAHVAVFDNGEVGAVWMISNQAEGDGNSFSDRGTGYNHRANGAWGNAPTARIESERSGFPNYLLTADGTEFIVSHRAANQAATIYRLRTFRRAAGATNWTQGDIPTSLPNGVLWSKAAVDGNTIYVIALTNIAAFGGAPVLGMDGHVMLYRSKDAGATWDIVDGVIPGLDQTAFAQIGSDGYSIAARDGIVAVGLFDAFNDVKLFKSYDGADTWEVPVTILDFPLDHYVIDDGYTEADLGLPDPASPNPLAVFTSDGSVSMLIDVLGNVHIFSGETYVQDDILTDGVSSYYPGVNGLMYWKESDPENLYEIAGALDLDGNDTLDFPLNSIIGYGTGMSSMPAAASDENGILYVVYSANLENVYDIDGKNYRHLYSIKSVDYGVSWTFPVDITYATDPDPDSTLAKLSEAVFPSAFKDIKDGKFHYVYQRDYIPGAALLQNGNQPSASDIIYVGDNEIVGTQTPQVNNIGLSLNPNPATDFTQVAFSLSQSGNVTIEVTDLSGAIVWQTTADNLNVGGQRLNLQTANLQNGIYFVKVRAVKQFGIKKLVVMH